MRKTKVDLTPFEEIAEELDIDISKVVFELASGDFDELYDWKKQHGKSDYKFITSDGGGEGGGEYCYGVFEFKGVIYKAEWSYYSYEGYNYDDIEYTLKEVKPVEKTITVYE